MQRATAIRSFLHNPLTLPFYLPSLIYAFCQGLLVPVLPLYLSDFGISYGLIGLALGAEGLGRLMGDVPSGMFLRRIGHRNAMGLGLGCAAVATTALVWAGSIPEVFVLRLLAGFGGALFHVGRHAFATDATPVGTRGRSMALMGGLFRMGGFAGPAVGGVVAVALGSGATFLLYGAVCSAAVLLVARYVKATDSKSGQQASPIQPWQRRPLVTTLRAYYRLLAAAGVGQFFAQMIRSGRKVIIPLYGADVLGLDAQSIGLIMSVSAAVEMPVFYPAGRIMDQFGRKFAIVPCFLLQAVGLSLVPLTAGFAGLMFVGLMVGLGNGLGSGTMMTLGADLAPMHARGEFLGVWSLIGDTGSTAGPVVVGAVAELFALPLAALAISAAGLAAAIVFARFVPETLKKPEQSAHSLS